MCGGGGRARMDGSVDVLRGTEIWDNVGLCAVCTGRMFGKAGRVQQRTSRPDVFC